jgi:adenylate kinase
MLGAQGTGKGTVAGLLSKGLNIPQISTGDIFRENISEKTTLGIEADKYISKGNLVPDSITVPMVEERLKKEDCVNGAILDGFPRTKEQAEALEMMLQKSNKKIDLVINLTTPKEEIIDRMITRRVCTNKDCKSTFNIKLNPPKVEGICDFCGSPLKQRDDDKDPKAIEKRLQIYEEQTSPLVQYYENKGILRTEIISTTINHMAKDAVEEILKDIK